MPRQLSAYKDTAVAPGRSMEQLERLLAKAKVHGNRWTNFADLLRLEIQPNETGEAFRIDVPIAKSYTDREREQNRRQAYRLLYWYVKAKLEAIENGISDFRKEFLPYMITGPETTFMHHIEAAIERGERTLTLGQQSPLLPVGREDVIEGEVRDA